MASPAESWLHSVLKKDFSGSTENSESWKCGQEGSYAVTSPLLGCGKQEVVLKLHLLLVCPPTGERETQYRAWKLLASWSKAALD